MSNNFVNLHLHSERSLLDGMIKVNDLVDKTLAMNQIASCITDHGNMYTIIDHFKRAEKMGQKPIAGFEAYMVKDRLIKGKSESEDESTTNRNHFLLLAKNNNGYKKLCKICSEGFITGKYYRPRIDNNVLNMFMDEKENDLIGTSACLAGIISQSLLHDDYDSAKEQALYYQKLFNGNFWLEIQPTEMVEQFKVNKGLIELSKDLSIPLVATTDAHYLNKEDKSTHDVLLCLQSGSLMSDPSRWRFQGNSYYVMSRDEIVASFKKKMKYKKILVHNEKRNVDKEFYVYDYDGARYESPDKIYDGMKYVEKDSEKFHDRFIDVLEEGTIDYNDLDQVAIEKAIDESEEIAKQCNVHFGFDKHYLPKINIPVEEPGFKKWRSKLSHPEKPNEDYLKYLCIKGLREKKLTSKEYRDRLKYELGIIDKMDFPDYFLIYYDIADFCHTNNVPLGPGRGCFDGDNVVKTTNGIKPLKNVSIGDVVYCHDELKHPVIAKHEYDIEEKVASIACDEKVIKNVTLDHKILAIKKYDFDNGIREPKWYSAEELDCGDYICEGES